jgi:hypothetical protein
VCGEGRERVKRAERIRTDSTICLEMEEVKKGEVCGGGSIS